MVPTSPLRPAARDPPATMECPHDRPSHRAPQALFRTTVLRRRRRAVDALAGAGDGADGARGRGAAGPRALSGTGPRDTRRADPRGRDDQAGFGRFLTRVLVPRLSGSASSTSSFARSALSTP